MPAQIYEKFPYTVEALQWLDTEENRLEMIDFLDVVELTFPDALMAMNETSFIANNQPVEAEIGTILMVPIDAGNDITANIPCKVGSWVVKEGGKVLVYTQELFDDLIKNTSSSNTQERVLTDQTAIEASEEFIADFGARVVKNESDIIQLNQSIKANNDQIEVLTSGIQNVNSAIDNNNTLITQLQESSGDNGLAIEALQQDITNLQNDVVTLQNDVVTLQNDVVSNTNLIDTNTSDIVDLQNLALPNTGFRAYRNTAQGFTVGAGESTVSWQATSFNDGGNFNITTNQYTCPVSGYYEFNWQMMMNASTAGHLYISRFRTGTNALLVQAYNWSNTTTFDSFNMSAQNYLTAGTLVSAAIVAINSSLNMHNGNANTFFMGKFLRYRP